MNSGSGYRDGPFSSARFSADLYLASDGQGNIFVSDWGNRRIRKIGTDLVVSTFAGSGDDAYQDGTGIFCSFHNPTFLTVDPAGNVFVADSGQYSTIRKITPDGVVTTFVGSPYSGNAQSRDRMGTNASFLSYIGGLIADPFGNILAADSSLIRRVSPAGFVTTLAGSYNTPDYRDGEGRYALFANPVGLSLDMTNRLYIADTSNQRIRRLSFGQVPTNGLQISLYAGLAITGPIGKACRIDFTTSLSNCVWTPLATVTLSSSPHVWFDPDAVAGRRRFYRAVVLP